MNSTAIGTSTELLSVESDGANGTTRAAQAEWPVPEFKYRMADHPLWQEYLAELEGNRQADIAESNRLADLEEELESKN